MIPFNFEKFQSGAYKVITRDGKNVRDLAFSADKDWGNGFVDDLYREWNAQGKNKYYNFFDLFLIPIEPEENKETNKH